MLSIIWEKMAYQFEFPTKITLSCYKKEEIIWTMESRQTIPLLFYRWKFQNESNLTWSCKDLISSSVNNNALEFARLAWSEAWEVSAALRALSSYTASKRDLSKSIHPIRTKLETDQNCLYIIYKFEFFQISNNDDGGKKKKRIKTYHKTRLHAQEHSNKYMWKHKH